MQLWNVRKKDRGFTLVEIITVAVIFGVISAVAVPNLLGMINQARITDGVADIEGAMKEAQRQAIRFSQSCTLKFDTTTIDGEIRQRIQPDPAVGGNNNRCLLEPRILPEGVNVTITPDIDVIGISSKGNFDYSDPDASEDDDPVTDRNITVSHNHAGTQKCLRIEGLFGDVQTGIIEGSVCDTSL